MISYEKLIINHLCCTYIKGTSCRDKFLQSFGRFVYGGTRTNGNVKTLADCEEACLSVQFQTCYGFDFSTRGNPGCFLHYSQKEFSNVQVGSGVSHFRRQFTCPSQGATVSTPIGTFTDPSRVNQTSVFHSRAMYSPLCQAAAAATAAVPNCPGELIYLIHKHAPCHSLITYNVYPC